MKEEWKLLAGSPATTRKCPELDVGESSDIYDSSMVPKSMVTTDGQPLPLRDKTKNHENELLPLQEHSNSVDNGDHNSKRVILIDRMASVNGVHKDKDMNTWMVNYLSKKCSKVFEQSITKQQTSRNVADTTFKGKSQVFLQPIKRATECLNKSTRSLEICSKLTLKTPEQHQ